MGGFGLLGEDELEVMAQGGFDGDDVLIGHADLVRQRAEHGLGLLERGERAGAEAFVRFLKLLQHVEAGAFLGLVAEEAIELVRGEGKFLLDFAQALLAFLDGAALGLGVEFLGLDIRGELGEARTLAANSARRASRRARSSSSWIFSEESFSSRTTLPCFCRSRALISLRARVSCCMAAKASDWAWRSASC